MSKLIDELRGRQAVIAAETEAFQKKVELHRTMLSNATEPYKNALQELVLENWRPTCPNHLLRLSPLSHHKLKAWQHLQASDNDAFSAYFGVDEHARLTVKLGGKDINPAECLEQFHTYLAQWYGPGLE